MTKPLISSLERLTSQDTKTPSEITTVELVLVSQDPTTDAADMGRHLMRIESKGSDASESEKIPEELTIREIGVIFPEAGNE